MAAATIASMVAVPHWLEAQKAGRAADPTARPASLAVVRSISRAALPRGERIIILLTDEVRYTFDRLSNPDRVYFDLSAATVGAPAIAAAKALGAGPIVNSIRLARHSEHTTRLVLTLGADVRYSAFPLYNPFRLAIDLETEPTPSAAPAAATPPPQAPPAESAGPAPPSNAPGPAALESPVAAASAPPPPPPPSLPPPAATIALPSPTPASALRRGDYSLARQLGLRIARVVIDAGHGGHDPGARSNGLTESELVLDVALRLEQLLEKQPGVEVVLTRRTDEFIALEERTAIANREGADLFLSIHANASRRTAVRGIETYFLNFATDPAAEAVAARENATSTRTMGHLPELVKTIALNNKVVESRELATIVQTSLVRRLRLQNKSVRDLGVKHAPFVVLIGAQMPSVLAEISFLTNKTEANLLKQPAYRQRIAQSLSDAVVKYQTSLKKPAAAVTVKAQGQ